ncbi:MAG: hypothetical protein ACXAAT_18230, partial [Candidatus Hodarchaeales archaeon]
HQLYFVYCNRKINNYNNDVITTFSVIKVSKFDYLSSKTSYQTSRNLIRQPQGSLLSKSTAFLPL